MKFLIIVCIIEALVVAALFRGNQILSKDRDIYRRRYEKQLRENGVLEKENISLSLENSDAKKTVKHLTNKLDFMETLYKSFDFHSRFGGAVRIVKRGNGGFGGLDDI